MVNDKSAELREWWGVAIGGTFAGAIRPDGLLTSEPTIHVREVPSPERVRAALDEWAVSMGFGGGWSNYSQHLAGSRSMLSLLTLFRSLGIDTEGV